VHEWYAEDPLIPVRRLAQTSAPDVEPWMEGERPAIPSTPVADAVRPARAGREPVR
jgi:hypothetical protein